MILILLAGALFAFAAWGGIAVARYVCAGIETPDDGPAPGHVPERVLIIASAILGAFAASRGVPLPGLLVVGAACGLLSAIWAADVTRGIIPDVFTLAPLGAILIAAALSGHWEVVIAAVVPALPFAFLAWKSKGMGLGWGDVKLAALGGALLGMQQALLFFAIGALAAVIVARVRGMHGRPIAFAPYLASAIAVPFSLFTPGMHP
ncbi:MAG TPA: prepilin peptidase [Candidatus Elarobacter sp.]